MAMIIHVGISNNNMIGRNNMTSSLIISMWMARWHRSSWPFLAPITTSSPITWRRIMTPVICLYYTMTCSTFPILNTSSTIKILCIYHHKYEKWIFTTEQTTCQNLLIIYSYPSTFPLTGLHTFCCNVIHVKPLEGASLCIWWIISFGK